ncbi:MAG TPA: hypothetical protein VFN51_00140 [Candidatus Saccharimonadales bacterium]|nr:hypothetical protein [Candidatus Saccharimonadales bacterium]
MNSGEGISGPDKNTDKIGADQIEPDSSLTKSKKKKRKSIGSRLVNKEVVESKAPVESDSPKSIYDIFLKTEESNKEKAKPKPEPESEAHSKSDEEELADLEQVTPEEESFVIKQLRRHAREARKEESADEQEEEIAHQALDSFDSKIIEDDIKPETALEEVLRDFNLEEVEEPEEKLIYNRREAESRAPGTLPQTIEVPLGDEEGMYGHFYSEVADGAGRNADRHMAEMAAAYPSVPITEQADDALRSGFTPVGSETNTSAGAVRPAVITRDRLRYIDLSEGFLTGGLYIGSLDYLIGRRRGRLKAERKAKRVQKKLEAKVQKIESDLNNKEYVIRKLVSDKARAQRSNQAYEKKIKQPAEIIQKPIDKNIIVQRMEKERAVAPQAQRLHGNKATEKIGSLLVTGEAPLLAAAGAALLKERPLKPEVKTQAKKTEYVEPLSNARIETMNRNELMDLSSKIIVNGSSLRQIYETHLIGERGLRRLIEEHNRGGDVPRALRNEIVEREIDFERDPILRDSGRVSGNQGASSVDSSVILKRMIKEAEENVSSQEEEVAFYKAKADFELRERQRQQKQRKVIDTAIITVVVILVAVIVMITLLRGR